MSIVSAAENMTAFLNPLSAGYDQAERRAAGLGRAAGLPEFARITDLPEPKHVQDSVNGQTIIYSGGGDGTVNRVVEAIIGHVRDDPEASALNQSLHSELAFQLLYIAGPDGTANNFPRSVLTGRDAQEPARLVHSPRLRVGLHRPLTYEVTDASGDISLTGIATNCIGLGGAAVAAANLETAKPELANHPHTRLVRESLLALNSIVNMSAFSVVEKRTAGRDVTSVTHHDITAYELVGSRVYAKLGRTHVNIDDAQYQPSVLRHQPSSRRQRAATIAVMLGVSVGMYPRQPIRLHCSNCLELRNVSDEPVPFHSDGDIGPRFQVYPGQTLRLQSSTIAVPVAMTK